MRSYEIRIDINRLLHYSESLRFYMDNKTLLLLIESFTIYVRDLYLDSIESSISSSRYRGNWEPVEDEGYLEFLDTNPSGKSIVSLMKEAIEIRKSRNTIVIRYSNRYKYPNSRHSLLTVLKAIDNGTSKFNARPLLKNIIYKFNSNISSLWRDHLIQKGVF